MKAILYLSVAGLMLTACQKEDPAAPETPSGAKKALTTSVGPVPTNFIKKVMVEEFTSQTNGSVPESDRFFDNIAMNTSGRVIIASLYNGGYLSNPETTKLLTTLTPGTPIIPCGSVDRTASNGTVFLKPTHLQARINGMLLKPATCGLAIDSKVNGRRATVDVHVGFSANQTSMYSVHAYLIEDLVTTGMRYCQANNFNNTVGSPFFQMGNPIVNYVHRTVMRKMITNTNGDLVNPANLVAGGTEVFNYQVDLMEKSNPNSHFMVVAFITDNLTGEIMNVQRGQLGSLADWN